uniref:Phospholipid scramblase n=1 Tax=Elaeophora elaphi TaxID=1147741 RepID=A0A0R3S1I9_9BILA
MEKMLTCSSFFGGRCGTYPVCCILSTDNSYQIIIESPPGLVIGAVVQEISLIRPYYQVKDAKGNLKYFIIGSTHNFSCFAYCCCNIQYEVISADKNILIGIIVKEWAETDDRFHEISLQRIKCFCLEHFSLLQILSVNIEKVSKTGSQVIPSDISHLMLQSEGDIWEILMSWVDANSDAPL